ncbi:MAG: L-threonylcarbamoyladenylate synthase [Candidatus Diapherotrites archaeon]|nr:L-threonylcarbamoyladenylate synthase [Candidatus Diapherotrites archaeon]
MKTKILKPSAKSISQAAKILCAGGLVAFPTETVYGLGANALNAKAVSKIFKAKGRPSDNPLIVHVSSIEQVPSLVKKIPNNAKVLMNKFWPGPLTLVLSKSPEIPKIVTAGLDSVAIRMPAHKVALELIRAVGFPLAAPSANLSTTPSPTNALHVFEDLHDRISLILDGGSVRIGVESTVLDLTGRTPTILRPGAVTLEQLRKVLGKVKVHKAVHGVKSKVAKVKSPGLKHKHYSPKAKVLLFTGARAKALAKIRKEKSALEKQGFKAGIISISSPKALAKSVFKKFREFDTQGVHFILVAGVEEKGIGFAVMNRLKRAASKEIKA